MYANIADSLQMIPAAALFFLMFSMPESPRWHLLKVRTTSDPARRHYHYEQAFLSLWRLRHTMLQAGRDLIMLDKLIDIEMKATRRRHRASTLPEEKVSAFRASLVKYKAIWSRKNLRCRRAMIATLIVMVMQQLVGVNNLAYYSSSIFLQSSTGVESGCAAANITPTGQDPSDALGDPFGVRHNIVSRQ